MLKIDWFKLNLWQANRSTKTTDGGWKKKSKTLKALS